MINKKRCENKQLTASFMNYWGLMVAIIAKKIYIMWVIIIDTKSYPY